MDPEARRAALKIYGGAAAGLGANVVGIPLDRFRVEVAQDVAVAEPVADHLRRSAGRLVRAPLESYAGGAARCGQKGFSASLNLLVPREVKDQSPFAASAAAGFAFAPVLNAFRILQLGKINMVSYQRTCLSYASPAGLAKFAKNTALFAPGEAVRMMTCFGTKDALMNLMPARLRAPPATAAGVAERSLLLAAALGPAVAVVETSVSLATETATLLNAQAAGEGSLHEAMALAMRPAYLSRCWVALLAKNVLANSTTFFFMFAADFASNA